MFYTYVLESRIDPGHHYTGHTADLKARLAEHNHRNKPNKKPAALTSDSMPKSCTIYPRITAAVPSIARTPSSRRLPGQRPG
jgi:predicted GIY-YIG superfamily endonuclease